MHTDAIKDHRIPIHDWLMTVHAKVKHESSKSTEALIMGSCAYVLQRYRRLERLYLPECGKVLYNSVLTAAEHTVSYIQPDLLERVELPMINDFPLCDVLLLSWGLVEPLTGANPIAVPDRRSAWGKINKACNREGYLGAWMWK